MEWVLSDLGRPFFGFGVVRIPFAHPHPLATAALPSARIAAEAAPFTRRTSPLAVSTAGSRAVVLNMSRIAGVRNHGWDDV